MIFTNILQFFVLGLSVSTSFCWTSCVPVIFFIFSINEKNFFEFLKTILKFSTIKFVVQISSVSVIYIFGGQIFAKHTKYFYPIIIIIFGTFFLFLGISQIRKYSKISSNNIQHYKLSKKFFIPITGFLSGINICLPKIFVLGYVFLKSKNLFEVLGYTTIFTIGEILSPMIIFFIFINLLKIKLEKIKSLSKQIEFFSITLFIILGMTNLFLGIKSLLLH